MELKEKGHENIEVINAGVPGHASYDSLGRLLSRAHFFEPDVVAMINTWNDLKYFHLSEAPLSKVNPYDPKENPRRNYLNSLDRSLGQNSQFYLWLRNSYFSWNYNPRRSRDFYSNRQHDKLTEEALRQYRLTVESFVDVAKNLGAEPILVVQPRLVDESLNQEESRKIRYQVLSLTPQTTLDGFRRADRILESVAREQDVPVFEFSTLSGSGSYFYDHVHLKPNGARKLSKEFAEKLLEVIEGH
jgi:lysophospholipase L1-like esterase